MFRRSLAATAPSRTTTMPRSSTSWPAPTSLLLLELTSFFIKSNLLLFIHLAPYFGAFYCDLRCRPAALFASIYSHEVQKWIVSFRTWSAAFSSRSASPASASSSTRPSPASGSPKTPGSSPDPSGSRPASAASPSFASSESCNELAVFGWSQAVRTSFTTSHITKIWMKCSNSGDENCRWCLLHW